MYSKQDYLRNFQSVDSDTLLDRLAGNELTVDARDAMRDVLQGRGVSLPVLAQADISDDDVLACARAIKQGPCPRCRRHRSLVDWRTEHWVWSAILYTRFGRRRSLACRECGRRGNWKALASSTLLGWWGVPFGLLVTPYKIIANVGELLTRDKHEPSHALRDFARAQLAMAARPGLVKNPPHGGF